MTGQRETTAVHTRLSQCALEVEDSRAFWARADGPAAVGVPAQQAFDEYWFGARSLPRVEVLLANMRARFDAFPAALAVLHGWPHMEPEARRVICHWHLQLTDPLYRSFTGGYLAERRAGTRPEVTRDLVAGWVGLHGPDHWTMTTRIQFASKLLSAAYSATWSRRTGTPAPSGPHACRTRRWSTCCTCSARRSSRERCWTTRTWPRSGWTAPSWRTGCGGCPGWRSGGRGTSSTSAGATRTCAPGRMPASATATRTWPGPPGDPARVQPGPALPARPLQEAFAALRRDLIHEDGPRISTMRNYRFAIVQYDPAAEFELRGEVQHLSSDLVANGWVVFSVNLQKLLLDRVRAQGADWVEPRHGMEGRLAGLDPERGLNYLKDKLTPLIEGPDGIAADCSRLIGEYADAHPDIVDRTLALIGRAGALYPFFRSSALLRHLDGRTRNVPVVLLYPGERRGPTGLSFMGDAQPGQRLPATHLSMRGHHDDSRPLRLRRHARHPAGRLLPRADARRSSRPRSRVHHHRRLAGRPPEPRAGCRDGIHEQYVRC